MDVKNSRGYCGERLSGMFNSNTVGTGESKKRPTASGLYYFNTVAVVSPGFQIRSLCGGAGAGLYLES